MATTFIWFTWFTASLLFVRLSERQSVCNKTKKFRETSSKDYWRNCSHWSKIHQKCRIQFLWSNSSLPDNKWYTIRAFNIIALIICNTDRSRLHWLDHRSILPSLVGSSFDLAFISYIIDRACLHWLCYVQTPEVFCKVEGLRRRGYGRTYPEIVSCRNKHRGACCEFYDSRIWVNVPKRCYNTFHDQCNRRF